MVYLLSICLNWTFFAVYYGSGVMRRNMYSSAVFVGGDLFALEFYLDRVIHCRGRVTTFSDTSDAYIRYWQNDQLRSDRTCPALQSTTFTGPAGLQSRRPFSPQCVTTSTYTKRLRDIHHQPFLASEYHRHWPKRWWRPHPSAFPRFDTIPKCDGRTDGRTDGWIVVAYTAL